MVVMETLLLDGSNMLYTVDSVTLARLASSLGFIPRSAQSSAKRFATASFTGMRYAIIRAAQQHTADTVPGTGMAVITDAGMRWDPPQSQTPGGRTARLAGAASCLTART